MPCLLALLALISPRLALFCLWLFSDVLGRAYDSWLVPVLGFFLLPWTTLAYAVMWAAGTNEVMGLEWFLVALGQLGARGAPSLLARSIRCTGDISTPGDGGGTWPREKAGQQAPDYPGR